MPTSPTKGYSGNGGGIGGSNESTSSSIASKKYYQNHLTLQQEQLYDNSEVNRMVVERSMEWNGKW